MASNNRATLINKVIKVVKKHFKPADVPQDRTLLEHLVFACCVENTLHDDAEKVYQTLTSEYFDWNEVRVTSIRELADVMKPLNDSQDAATRLKRVLQSVFESHYSFDLEAMKKQNLGQAVKQFEQYNGTTPFVVSFVTQHGLGGHSIPINRGLLRCMHVVGVISDSEAAKRSVPGLERAIPKTKGAEIGSLLHQLGVEMHRSPHGPTIRKYLLEIDPDCKDRLPKRSSKKTAKTPAKKSAEEAEPAPAKQSPAGKAAPKKKKVKKKTATKTGSPAKKKTKKKTTTAKKAARKTAKKKVVKKKTAKKKAATKKLKKKKPR